MTQTDLSLGLRTYLQAARAIPLIAPLVLRRRKAKGKELPDRWREKMAKPSKARPDGTLIWLHAVGLGEVLALRGLITQMADFAPDASFLVTSTTAKGAQAIAANLPPRTLHQFLPLDAPSYCARFLDHWKPDLCVWTDQDLWPAMAVAVADRAIPQAIVAARMDAASHQKRKRAEKLYRAVYDRMALIDAQDEATRDHLTDLGATDVQVRGSLKPTAPPLLCNPDDLEKVQSAVGRRFVWITAPSHPADEAIAREAHKMVLERRPDALLIISPRHVDRVLDLPPDTPRWSDGDVPRPDQSLWLADTTGELGLFYRITHCALIGGTHDDTEGHNPWEAIALNTAVLHGPRTANFTNDYARLDREHAAISVTSAKSLAAYLCADLTANRVNALEVLQTYHANVAAIAADLLALTCAADD
ncbi:3-deoxy-D-manno-octulosonic acid transferase [Yoonia sp. 208BN28-4]|uniref:3-deoxy-D-manno-octulosonic acid transferase n=1 Tax=Yoonia sp. 208BN28-4 TaxID=3126505 RepID=UPI0030B6A398